MRRIDPISITETPESISITIPKPLGSSEDLTDLLREFLQLYLDEQIAINDPDIRTMDDLARSLKESWWKEHGDDFLRDVDRKE